MMWKSKFQIFYFLPARALAQLYEFWLGIISGCPKASISFTSAISTVEPLFQRSAPRQNGDLRRGW